MRRIQLSSAGMLFAMVVLRGCSTLSQEEAAAPAHFARGYAAPEQVPIVQ